MNVKDLILYNKEGHHINMNYDEVNDIQYAKMYMDKNSTDTFKTAGLYLFEKVAGSNRSLQSYLSKFQIFNTNGYNVYPRLNSNKLIITNIKSANLISTFNTKWVYATDIEKFYYIGQFVFFTGLDGWHGIDFDSIITNDFDIYSGSTSIGDSYNLFQIIEVQIGRVLISTATANNTVLPAFSVINAIINPMNIITVERLSSFQLGWSETTETITDPVDGLYKDKIISLISKNSLNEGIYTVNEITNVLCKVQNFFLPDIFTPEVGDSIDIEITVNTDRILLAEGFINFVIVGNYINVPYIPKFLKIGDLIQAEEKTTTLINTSTYNITGFDYTLNYIYVSPLIVSNQYVDCYLYLASNKINLISPVLLDNNNIESLPVTYNSLINQYSAKLYKMGIDSYYHIMYDKIVLKPVAAVKYDTTYLKSYLKRYSIGSNAVFSFTLNGSGGITGMSIDFGGVGYLPVTNYRLEIINNTGINAVITLTTNGSGVFISYVIHYIGDGYSNPIQYNVYVLYNPDEYMIDVLPIYVKEDLIEQETLLADVGLYNRQLEFTTIDTFGLNININGIDYNTPYNTSVTQTVTDWYNLYNTILLTYGVVVTHSTYKITIANEYANVPVYTKLNLGDFSDYIIKYKNIRFGPISPTHNYIKSQLLITINGLDYLTVFNTDDFTTIGDWIIQHSPILLTLGIKVTQTLNSINFDLKKQPEDYMTITYNVGYLPKFGDLSVYVTDYAIGAIGSMITGNELRVVPGEDNFLQYYATGQKITISGADKIPQNKAYNIIGLNDNKLSLSYQGTFWQQGLPEFTINIISDYFIRYPKYGESNYDNQAKLQWTWKDKQISDFFFYDFSGNQLTPINRDFPAYNGPMPLCGSDGTIQLSLNDKPNDKLQFIADPTKQQTIFNVITNTLPYIDATENINVEPESLQVFIGYKADVEGYSKTRLYLDYIEDVTFNLTTTNVSDADLNTDFDHDDLINDLDFSADDLFVFVDNYVEVKNVTTPFNFIDLGFRPGQIIEITGTDINSDNRNIATLLNGGSKLKIKEVFMHKIIFTVNVFTEISVKIIAKTTPPYYANISGTMMGLRELRTMNVNLKVIPKVIMYIDLYGESEEEDIRHKINLNNRNKNVLKMQDFFIFKSVDIQEEGIDWIFLNRKRKELLEIYPEIFNNLGSYKSIIQAINFFGYNDLTFTEFFQNINPESLKFGQLMNLDLMDIFNKEVAGWSYQNTAYENLRNSGYRKTNLFSLNYKITDGDGNFISSYSLDEVKIKLLGLKKWITENLLPIGTKIVDINGKYNQSYNYIIQHDSYKVKTHRVEEYAAPIEFTVTGTLQPITTGSDTYDIAVQFSSQGPIDFYDYRIKTFYLEEWSTTNVYLLGDIVYHNGITWIGNAAIGVGEEPGISNLWDKTTINTINGIQLLKDYKWDDTGVSFTINRLIDPHFIIEVFYHSGYGCTKLNTKTFTVIPGFFDTI